VQRPWIGADMQDVTPDIAESLGFARPEGALLVSLHPQSPLRLAGLKLGDVILAVDGHPIENARELGYRIATSRIGQQTIVEYQRSGKLLEANVKLIAAPETTRREETLLKQKSPLQGMVVANLSPAVAEELGIPTLVNGVVALDIKGGIAQRFFKRGDILVDVNGVTIATVDDLQRALADDPGSWEIQINRAGQKLQLKLR